ncbi:MAG: TonB-dependent receptor [Cyclobacteriaceae bacterium]|nr:TonB-dependent receptor [Cyclobacteriaceae bacterium]
MEKFYKRSMGLMLTMLLAATIAYAQTTVSGSVKDEAGNPVPGINIKVKGTVAGTISDVRGNFSVTTSQAPPIVLEFSFIGFITQEIQITDANTTGLNVTMRENVETLGEVVVVGTSRGEESFMKAPVTVEKIDILAIQQTTAPDFFDALANVKGVQVNSGSLNFTQVNTRGFASIANVRFVQLVDGMDTSAPLLNFPTGNIVAMSELDAESMELVPGAASALYGPNAFNGILMMKSKSPFEYQGLSAMFKGGITTSDAQGESFPMYNFAVRYAKAFNNKFAFKVNFSLMQATDWKSNDYRTDRLRPESTVDLSGTPNFDGLNLYGDETPIPVPIGGTFGTLDLRRTGFREEDILDNDEARSMKADVAFHYKLTDKMELLYNWRFGGGSSIYQGTEKYALRDFTQQFHKLELKGSNFFVRGYMTETKDGDSWNMSAQGGFMNEYYSPTASKWAPEYAQTYVLAMQGYVPGVPAGNPEAAHAAARNYADRDRPQPGSPGFRDLVNQVRGNLFQRTPPGSSFVDNSRLYHGEFNYQFKQIEAVDFMVGGNFRQYDLFSDGTVFNEDPEGDGNERIKINEFGFYGQVAKTLGESLRLTASLRYDKNENFDGQVTPRFSAVYTFSETHNIRASYQTGFRNPDTQAQFIFFPSSGGTLLGSTEANASRYGIHNGGAWTRESYNAYRASGGSLDPNTGAPTGGNPTLLQTIDLPYVAPEKLTAFEIGYKGSFNNKMLVDVNGYYTIYKDFIGGEIVVSKEAATHQGNQINAGSLFSPYVNNPSNVNSYGFGLGLEYKLLKGYTLSGSYNYATFEEDADSFISGFNMPENKINVGIGNRRINKTNLGFNINFRWQDAYLWESSFGSWNVPEFGVLDAQVSYRLPAIKTVAKLGGTNLLGGDYRTNFGAPFVGQQFYISLTFDEFFR